MKRKGSSRAAVFCLLAWGIACGGEAALQQSSALLTIDPNTPAGLQHLLRYDGESLHLVSAHRGGPRKGFPENCIATFEDTLRHTHAMMEVDPRYTKDGVIVLHHDPTLERTTNGTGPVVDHTWQELKALRLRDTEGTITDYSIPTLDEALQWARGRTILVLDQKDVPVEARARKVAEHNAEAYVVLIVYSFADAQRCHAIDKDIMMEVMIPNREQVEAFDKTGVPWSNIVAFVGHSPPQQTELCEMIHARGASCMGGTSRNIDRRLIDRRVTDINDLSEEYHALTEMGIDLIETDLPREVGHMLYGHPPVPASRAAFFQVGRR
jgi:glycerophosphoryl diester phosphodiesterase